MGMSRVHYPEFGFRDIGFEVLFYMLRYHLVINGFFAVPKLALEYLVPWIAVTVDWVMDFHSFPVVGLERALPPGALKAIKRE